MAAKARRDFAAILDELLAEHEGRAEGARAASLDYLTVMEELHSGRIHFADTVHAEYDSNGGSAPEDTGPGEKVEPPPVDPEAIARELGLRGLRARLPKNLDRLRRDFAMRNHPDRVPEHLRAHAMLRMQIANRLIDDAKRRRSGRSAS